MTGRLAAVVAVLTTGLLGWAVGGLPGAATGLTLAVAIVAVRWRRGRTPWSWLTLWVRRNRSVELAGPVTVANDRSGGGVRYQDGFAIVAVQLLGKAHTPTLLTGSTGTHTDNTVDLADLMPLLDQSLGLTLDSLSVVSAGARRRCTGDYPRVYDTLIGTAPYAGRRETWLIARIGCLDNIEALRWRTSVGTAAVAAGQRISARLRQCGIRTRVATATDILELERRLAAPVLRTGTRRWRSVRGDTGWWTTYGYRPAEATTDHLAQAWSLRADAIIQNITLFGDGTIAATVTVRSAQPPTVPPSVRLQTLPGEQALAFAANLCCPRPALRGVGRGRLNESVLVPIGPSGVLLGKAGAGNRLLLPLDDPAEFSRVQLSADDAVAKRIVVRLAGSGERITVHSTDPQRWASVRMPDVVLTDAARPAVGTTVSVTDGTVAPAPRPNTVVWVRAPGPPEPGHRGTADVLIAQTGPATVAVTAAGNVYRVEVEMFRAENRYVGARSEPQPAAELAGRR